MPEVFVSVVGGKAFTWELRRFGGIVLQRSSEVFSNATAARVAGEQALSVLVATPGLPTYRRDRERDRQTVDAEMPDDGPAVSFGQTTTTILSWLDGHGPATASEVGRALSMESTSMRGRLTMLARQGLVLSQPNDDRPPRQVYSVTAEGRRAAGVSDAQARDA